MSQDNGPVALRFSPNGQCYNEGDMSNLLQMITTATDPELIKIYKARGLEMVIECYRQSNCREVGACLLRVHRTTYTNPNSRPIYLEP